MKKKQKKCNSQILKWARESIDKRIQYSPGSFWDIYNSKTSTTWGWNDPMELGQYCIVFEVASNGFSQFDYITKEEYLKEAK